MGGLRRNGKVGLKVVVTLDDSLENFELIP
jgi:hypothetical protein